MERITLLDLLNIIQEYSSLNDLSVISVGTRYKQGESFHVIFLEDKNKKELSIEIPYYKEL